MLKCEIIIIQNIYIQLMFWFVKLYTNIQQDQKATLDYHMPMLCAYMAGGEGEGVGLKVLKCFVRGGQNFFLLALCVCIGGGRGGVRFSTSPCVKKIIDPTPINK